MSDLPQQVMVWHGYTNLEHIGMWSTTRYPEDAVAYVPLARLEAVEQDRNEWRDLAVSYLTQKSEAKARAERAEAALATARLSALEEAVDAVGDIPCDVGETKHYWKCQKVIRALAEPSLKGDCDE